MSEEEIAGIASDFAEAFVNRDVEKMLSFFAEDAVWVSPVGTFKGKEGLRPVLIWDTQISPTVKARRSGIALIVKGNKAVDESISECEYEGRKVEVPGITVFEFSDGRDSTYQAFLRQAVDRQTGDDAIHRCHRLVRKEDSELYSKKGRRGIALASSYLL
jgi:ketosteroid isomerase-like protein